MLWLEDVYVFNVLSSDGLPTPHPALCLFPLSLVSMSFSSLCWGRWCWAKLQQASGGPTGGGATAEAQVAGSSGIHTQPWRGRPHLGQNWGHPTAFRQAALPGASWHPTQHEATGESAACCGQALLPGLRNSGARLLSLGWEGARLWFSVAVLVTLPISVHPVPSAVDASVGSLAEEEEFRDVVSRYREKQL